MTTIDIFAYKDPLMREIPFLDDNPRYLNADYCASPLSDDMGYNSGSSPLYADLGLAEDEQKMYYTNDSFTPSPSEDDLVNGSNLLDLHVLPGDLDDALSSSFIFNPPIPIPSAFINPPMTLPSRNATSHTLTRSRPMKKTAHAKPKSLGADLLAVSQGHTSTLPFPASKVENGFDSPSPYASEEVDELFLKKQRRMMKNRESASLSRLRKKEFVDTLEQELHDVKNERDNLKKSLQESQAENYRLREELNQLRARSSSEKPSAWATSSITTGTSVFMICLFCFSFFTAPGSFLASRPLLHPPSDSLHTPGRTLLEVPVSDVQLSWRTDISKEPAVRSVPALSPHRLVRAEENTGVIRSSGAVAVPRTHHMSTEETITALGNATRKLTVYEKKMAQMLSQINSSMDEDGFEGSRELAHVTADADGYLALPTYKIGHAFRLPLLSQVHRRADTSYFYCTEVQPMFASTSPPSGSKTRVSLLMPLPSTTGSPVSDEPLNEDYDNMKSILQVDCSVIATNSYHIRSNTSATV